MPGPHAPPRSEGIAEGFRAGGVMGERGSCDGRRPGIPFAPGPPPFREVQRETMSLRRLSGPLLAALIAGLAGCEVYPDVPEGSFPLPPPAQTFTASEALKSFEADPAEAYRLGEGDAVSIQVWDRPDLSGPQTVGPDGAITIPVAGTISL